MVARRLGSAPVSRAGFGISPKRTFSGLSLLLNRISKTNEKLRTPEAFASTRDACATRTCANTRPKLFARAAKKIRAGVFAIQLCDEACADLSGANRFAFVSVREIPEAFPVHRLHHFEHATFALRRALRQKRQM